MTNRGPIIDSPDPPNPPYWGAKVFLGGHNYLTILIIIESNICARPSTSNIMLVIFGNNPTPQPHIPPEGGPMG